MTDEPDLGWMAKFQPTDLESIQTDEAMLLFGICRTIRPENVLEFGTANGHSAFVFLSAGVNQVFSVDLSQRSAALRLASHFAPKLVLLSGDSADYSPDWTQNAVLDLIFFDAGHSFAANQKTFISALPQLAPGGIIAVHDTGLWAKNHMEARHFAFSSAIETPEGVAHQPGERQFADWIGALGWNRIDFHSFRCLRHGLSLFQKPS